GRRAGAPGLRERPNERRCQRRHHKCTDMEISSLVLQRKKRGQAPFFPALQQRTVIFAREKRCLSPFFPPKASRKRLGSHQFQVNFRTVRIGRPPGVGSLSGPTIRTFAGGRPDPAQRSARRRCASFSSRVGSWGHFRSGSHCTFCLKGSRRSTRSLPETFSAGAPLTSTSWPSMVASTPTMVNPSPTTARNSSRHVFRSGKALSLR